MGVLKIKDDARLTLAKDPYDLFSIDEDSRTRYPLNRVVSFILGFTVTAVSLGTAALFAYNYYNAKEALNSPMAYFEVRTIDDSGRPVVGAYVKTGNTPLGVTDSFGEWRKYTRVTLGSTFPLSISKKVDGRDVVITKNLVVPDKMPSDGELEIKSSLRLAGAQNAVAPKPLSVASSSDTSNHSITVVSERPFLRDSVWITSPQVGSGDVHAIVEMMKKRGGELGLKMTDQSPWRIEITELSIIGQSTHLVRLKSFLNGSSVPEFSFLRVPQGDALKTARDMLWALTKHTSYPYEVVQNQSRESLWHIKGSPIKLWSLSAGRDIVSTAGVLGGVTAHGQGLAIESPSALCPAKSPCYILARSFEDVGAQGLIKKELILSGQETTDLDIYVSGFRAKPLGNKLYSYWANEGQSAMATAVRGQKIVWRGTLKSAPGMRPTVTVPSPALSRR